MISIRTLVRVCLFWYTDRYSILDTEAVVSRAESGPPARCADSQNPGGSNPPLSRIRKAE